jgi:hypothetical protein
MEAAVLLVVVRPRPTDRLGKVELQQSTQAYRLGATLQTGTRHSTWRLVLRLSNLTMVDTNKLRPDTTLVHINSTILNNKVLEQQRMLVILSKVTLRLLLLREKKKTLGEGGFFFF